MTIAEMVCNVPVPIEDEILTYKLIDQQILITGLWLWQFLHSSKAS